MNTRMTVVSKEHILGKEVSILGTLDEPLFRAKDVCNWLGQTNTSQMIMYIPEEIREEHVKKIKVQNGATATWVNYLTEFGVYFVLMRSRNKEAIKYQMKIMEILKSIRLKGYAVSENITEEQIAQLKKDAENKEALLKCQSGVIRVDDRFIDSLKKLIDLYENERSKLSKINAEDLFDKN